MILYSSFQLNFFERDILFLFNFINNHFFKIFLMKEPDSYIQDTSSSNILFNENNSLQFKQGVNSVDTDPLISKLPMAEQMEYSHISSYFQLVDDRNKRNFGMSTFIKQLNLIHHFVVRDDGGDALRGLVCGILFGNGFLLVNTDKLKRLTKRSKSCVNGCFQRLGFNVFRETQDLNGFFSKLLPDIDSQLINSRHWCIRKASDEAPICFIASIPLEISARCGFPNETYQMMTYPNYHPIPPTPQQPKNNIQNNTNYNINVFSPPSPTVLNDQMNIQMNLSVNAFKNGNNTENYGNNIGYNSSDKQMIQQHQMNFQIQQKIPQQLMLSNSSSESLDVASDPEVNNNFYTDIKSLLNR